MSEYTPEMSEVREQYWVASGDPRRDSDAWGEFDRAMAAHDAEVARKTLEGYADYLDRSMQSFSYAMDEADWDEHARTTTAIRAYAASTSTDKAGEGE